MGFRKYFLVLALPVFVSACAPMQHGMYYTPDNYNNYVNNNSDPNIDLYDPTTGQKPFRGPSNPRYSNTNAPVSYYSPDIAVYGLDGSNPATTDWAHPTASSSYAGQQSATGAQAYNARGQQLFTKRGPEVAESRRGIVNQVYFKHGQAGLDSSDRGVLEDVHSTYKLNPGSALDVQGHASQRNHVRDPIERSISNLKTSLDRAFHVSSALIRSGIPASAITTTGYGDTHQAAYHPSMDPEAASRRVDVRFSNASGGRRMVTTPTQSATMSQQAYGNQQTYNLPPSSIPQDGFWAPQAQMPSAAPQVRQSPSYAPSARQPMLLHAEPRPIPLYNQ